MRSTILAFMTAMLTVVGGAAQASVIFNFSYSATDGSGVAASGTLTTTPTATPGEYLITSIDGIRDGGFSMTLLPPGSFDSNDNLLFATSPFLDEGGFSFVSNNMDFNVYYDANNVCGEGIRQFEASTPVCDPSHPIDPNIHPIVFAASVPEPSTALIFGAALLGVGVVRRRLRHRRT